MERKVQVTGQKERIYVDFILQAHTKMPGKS